MLRMNSAAFVEGMGTAPENKRKHNHSTSRSRDETLRSGDLDWSQGNRPAAVLRQSCSTSGSDAEYLLMKSTTKYLLVLVTAPDVKSARNLARRALEARLIACANLVRNIESHYWWKDKIEKSPEVLLLMKTTSSAVADLEELVLANHPYDTPEFVVMNLRAGTDRYLNWILETVRR